jgi:hypothetical protein
VGRLAVLALSLALALAILGGASASTFLITQTSMGGAPLGKSRAFYRAAFPPPVFRESLEGGLDRLTFGSLSLQAYFRRSGAGAIGLLTWNRRFHTAAGIGPCSPLTALRRAYGRQLKPFRLGGRVAAYRLGRLIFTVGATGKVGVVQLSTRALSLFTALNALRCGDAGA